MDDFGIDGANGQAPADTLSEAPAAAPNGTGPLHEPDRTPQPSGGPVILTDLAGQLSRANDHIGGLISRVDQLETTVRRTDRQILMVIGIMALLLWNVKQLAEALDAAAA